MTDFIHTLFDNCTLYHADRTAVILGSQSITYKELNEKANRLSNSILHHAHNEAIIGISTTRCIEMIIGVLAILKSGKAYLPIDPSYPSHRIKQIVESAGIQWCYSSDSNNAPFTNAGLTIINGAEINSQYKVQSGKAGNLAYVLYTSGSTGKPKGVCMGHKALVNLLQWQQKTSSAGAGTSNLQFAPLSFDVSFQEIFASLTTGGTLVLIEDEMRLDPLKMLEVIQENKISRIYLPFIALQYLAEMAVSFKIFPACLTEIITAGEQLKITPPISKFISELPSCTLCNQYGPTECHVVTELQLKGDPANWPPLPNIGRPISQVAIFITDDNLVPLPDGAIGELIISGECLAEGYLHQPVLTAEKFIEWDHPEKGPMRIYRTGDMAKYLPSGEIEFLGRKDGQVKIRGNRIELGEIELVIAQYPAVKQVAVIAREDIPGQKYLAAYYISDGETIIHSRLKEFVAKSLPDFMVPANFVSMNEFPTTTSGKVDRNLLPRPEFKRPDVGVIYKKPVTVIEKNIAHNWSDILQIDKIGLDDNFFEIGGNSLLAQKTVSNLNNQYKYILPITKLYQFPTVSGIAAFLKQDKNVTIKLPEKSVTYASSDIAIIGMAGRFPGANTIEEFWDILKDGKETIQFFSKEELDPVIAANIKNDPDYVAARGIIEGADKFDAAFFDINPKLAELMDPQQRIFLEIAWEVLEKTGCLPHQYKGTVGVFAGTGTNSYYYNNVHGHSRQIDQVGSFQVMTVNEKDYISSRTAYQLNLKGPAVSIYSACSTSLLAIAEAVESIRNGQTDVAVAGGASITSPLKSGHMYQEGAMLSKDGHCRSFDANATGTVFSDGAGAVLLKGLEAAKKDGDTIFAVIKGVGINNDGGGKGSFTAPSSEGQAHAIAMAIRDAAIDPSTLSYIETHGTATPLGDPIEIEGLKMAFGEQSLNQFCAIGSVKSNIGHLTAAAGVTGLIKTALALHHKQIPPSLGFATPNPNINFEHSPFYVNTKLLNWKSQSSRRAGVSSFGVGGTNVHLIMEDYEMDLPESSASRPAQLITWSAKSENSLVGYASKLAAFTKQNNDISLADLAFSLQLTRADFNYRAFLLVQDATELVNALDQDTIISQSNFLKELPAETIFLFPGQGSQYLNMGLELYQQEIVYREAVDTCAALLKPLLETDIRQILFPAQINETAEVLLKNTRYTQPAIFVTEYALGKLWMSWGIEPSVYCGHSIGEFVAACFAGIFSLEDALYLIAARGKMVSELPRGSMLSVRLAADDLKTILPAYLSIAAINSNQLCVVAGEMEAIDGFSNLLNEQSIANKKLQTSHAFHSSMMDSIIDEFEKIVSHVKLNHPRKPIVSTVTGNWLTDEQATDPQYWSGHLRSTVLFGKATGTILNQGNVLFIEVGPGNALSTLVKQQSGGKTIQPVTSLEKNSGKKSEYESLLKALGQVWLNGITPDWKSFYSNQKRNKISLPAYSFDRKNCWVNPITTTATNDQLFHSDNTIFNGQLVPQNNTISTEIISIQPVMRKDNLIEKIKEILEDASGIDTANAAANMTFLELGLDSLLLTQLALTFKKEFGLPLTFRQLNEEFATLETLAQYLDENLPAHQFRPAAIAPLPDNQLEKNTSYGNIDSGQMTSDLNLQLIAQQLQILSKQVALIQGTKPVLSPINEFRTSIPVEKNISAAPVAYKTGDELSPEETIEIKKPFGATARIERQVTELTEKQNKFLKELTEKYNQKTSSSKKYAQQHRSYMSDPRVVSGFKPLTKEIVYPIVVNKSAGSKLWDIDGNEYIDVLNGFGSSMLGYQPDIIKKALHEQIESGFEVGPQHELAGEVSKLVCELTGFDRAALCSTGSEAVLGAMRIARTVTGRSLIVAFTGSYHGIVDEVIVRGTKKLKSYPAAPGIMPEAVQNMLILDYGTEESLQIIKDRANELAAVLVEPVQSRRPEFRPVEFLKEVRKITALSGTALIFDEVITGFRMHAGGAQAMFGIKADISSYGKVVGGGIPIGVIAGSKEWMDALDGGFWQYGDNSFPEVGVTYFAGTFVRHPLALAAAKVSLEYMKEKGADLQRKLNAKGDKIANALNPEFEKRNLPFFIAQFGSLWKIKFKEEVPYGELLFTLMRYKGVHVWDGFPCFMTEAISNAEIDEVIKLFIESTDEMINAGFFGGTILKENSFTEKKLLSPFDNPPVVGAKLGRDKEGNPAWFIADKDRPGKYLRLELNK
jgi:amino acid adenylation domain-containing protein